MVDGEILAEAQNATRLRAWWEFAPGTHSFWIEGKSTVDSQVEHTSPALVVIETSAATTVTSLGN
jgi:hypothetical protein